MPFSSPERLRTGRGVLGSEGSVAPGTSTSPGSTGGCCWVPAQPSLQRWGFGTLGKRGVPALSRAEYCAGCCCMDFVWC